MKLAASLTALVLSLSTFTACATTEGDEVSVTDDEATSAGKLSFFTATDGQWHFNLKSGNGSILLTSEAYTARTGAITGALSVLDNGVDPAQFPRVLEHRERMRARPGVRKVLAQLAA